MPRAWVALVLGWGLALASSGSWTSGVWLLGPEPLVRSTFSLEQPLGGGGRLYLYGVLPLVGGGPASGGVGVSQSMEAGLLGRGEFGLRAFLRSDLVAWVEVWSRASLGPGAFRFRLGYAGEAPGRFWPGEVAAFGYYGAFSVKYRLSRHLIGWGAVRLESEERAWEAVLRWQKLRKSYALGVGFAGRRSRGYAVFGVWERTRTEAYGAELRVGAKSELKLNYAERGAKVGLTLSYPPEASAQVQQGPWALAARVDSSGFSVHLRYTRSR